MYLYTAEISNNRSERMNSVGYSVAVKSCREEHALVFDVHNVADMLNHTKYLILTTFSLCPITVSYRTNIMLGA
jgi:hypothetical protein